MTASSTASSRADRAVSAPCRWPLPLRSYSVAVVAVTLASAGTYALHPWMGSSVSILFFPAVIAVAVYGGYGPALLTTLLSTLSLAFFFVQPYYSLNIGADDAMRLTAFAVVALVTASISSARMRAEEAQNKALGELRGALATLQKVSGWPLFVDVNLASGASKLLAHAATVAGCEAALVVWEEDDEPWMYLAHSSGGADPITRSPPGAMETVVPPALERATFVSMDPLGDSMTVIVSEQGTVTEWQGRPCGEEICRRLGVKGIASAPFEVERLRGRMFFGGVATATEEMIPLVEVVAREVGNSLERLHLHDRLQQIAVREDRIHVARDLHDGVLQSLTGIRLRLQALAGEADAPAFARDRLLAVERAIAIEQRELRVFIEDLKPVPRPVRTAGSVAHAFEELRRRLTVQWNTPITVRVSPEDLSLPPGVEQTLRLTVREAIINALKHAHPSRVSVDVQADAAGGIRVVVTDDGRGFPFRGRLEHHEIVAANAGPVSLRERLVSAGGSIAIESMPTGSRVELTLPLSGRPAGSSG